jgi:hypothetical protein
MAIDSCLWAQPAMKIRANKKLASCTKREPRLASMDDAVNSRL